MPEFSLESLVSEQSHDLGHDHITPAHVHPKGHLVYPASGVLSMVTDAGSWIAPSNRAVWIPAGFTHQHRAHGDTDMRIMFFSDVRVGLLSTSPAVLVFTALAREVALALTSSKGRDCPARQRLPSVIIDDLAAAEEQPLHLPELTV